MEPESEWIRSENGAKTKWIRSGIRVESKIEATKRLNGRTNAPASRFFRVTP